MKNLKRFAKILLITMLILIVGNIVVMTYAYITSTRALKDTLSSVALIVAEDNCISNDVDNTGTVAVETKVDSLRKLLVSNSTIWLTYNTTGSAHEGSNITDDPDEANRGNGGGLIHSNVAPTNLAQATTSEAMSNLVWNTGAVDANTYSAIKLSLDGSNTNNPSLYSYLTCPQRGTPITVHLNATMKYRFITIFGTIDLSIPIHEQLTVVGMKFYRGRDGGATP